MTTTYPVGLSEILDAQITIDGEEIAASTTNVASTVQITKDEVLALWATGPRWSRTCDEPAFEKYYARPVTAFGIEIRLDDHPGAERWTELRHPLPALSVVDLSAIRYSTQIEGVLASVIAAVIENGTDVAPCDPGGWFNNEHPVLFGWPDGTYTVRDGNHRCIGGRLRGDATVRAHVIPYDFDGS